MDRSNDTSRRSDLSRNTFREGGLTEIGSEQLVTVRQYHHVECSINRYLMFHQQILISSAPAVRERSKSAPKLFSTSIPYFFPGLNAHP